MDKDTRIGLAVVLATVVGFITFLAVADFGGMWLLKRNPHYSMAGLASATYGFYAGIGAALITYLLVAFWGGKKVRRKADNSAPGGNQQES